jgi:hypothetical protein
MINQNKPESFTDEEGEPVSDEIFQKLKEASLINASETVCGMINDFFEPIITESIEQEKIEI